MWIAPSLGARTTAALTALTLTAAVAVPAALTGGNRERPVRGAASGVQYAARTDQIRAREWHLGVMRAARAWKWTRGSGVTVAVLDTGVDRRHPDLTGRVLDGPDLTGGARKPGGSYWGVHGTSMASIIAGHGHGSGLSEGVLGIAPQSRVLSVRVTLENDDPLRRGGQTVGDPNAIAQGIRYAVDHGADIINMSLGGGHLNYNGTPSQEAAIEYALGKGVVLIASAGNDGSGANSKNFPAAYPGVIAVGALDRRLRLWKDSNRRSHASVCAPGVDIVSADSSGGYVVGTGTSASSAMVAGVAALVRARYPRLTPDQVRQALVQGSPPRRGHPTGSATCAGPVDAVRTLLAASRLNKGVRSPVASAKPSAPAAGPAAASDDDTNDLLVPGALGGGGLLLVLALLIAWRLRRRRRRADEGEPLDVVPEYGLPSPTPYAPIGMEWTAAPADLGEPVGQPLSAPVDVPPWGGDEPYSAPSYPPMPPMPDEADHIPLDPPAPASELHPFVPEEYPGSGRAGQRGLNGANGVNGHGLNGHGLNGHGLNGHGVPPNGRHHGPPSDAQDLNDTDPLNDDDWERFRRGALDDPGRPDFSGPPPMVPPPATPPPAAAPEEPPHDPHDPLDPRNPLDPRDLLEPRDLGDLGTPRDRGTPRDFGTPRDVGGPHDLGAPQAPGGSGEFGDLGGLGAPRDLGTPRDPGTPREVGTPRDLGTPRDPGTPREVGGSGEFGSPGELGAPRDLGTPRDPGTPRDLGGPRDVEGPRDLGGPGDLGSWESREAQEARGPRDPRGPRDGGARDSRETLGPRDSFPPAAPPADDEDYRPPWW
ncbi:S8 family peptidase [Actinomadura terrae]|uniref:S8 family peptidase n=1 Tax=Actinomadura terrae TaxID=604353 RepID=UPI001FA7634F|nr:S8 family serine peptidase [Actinomadura terrae]